MSEPRPAPEGRTAFPRLYAMQTRWNDVDRYGHMNNVVYLEYFDSALNRALIGAGALDFAGTGPIGIVAKVGCDYFSEVSYPDEVEVGVRIERIGSSSLTWGFGLFRSGAPLTAAVGRTIHVYVDRASRRPQPLSPELRALAATLHVPRKDPAS
ncbi:MULTISPECIES: acyl-CoA thioesterase [Xanthobacter]|jgi:acyl-CoA thioester hydrolase|uniref:Thioesterase family protein n=1 Tax=Xanthobacter aminoxidans TaxID=186280 RepID=A0ABW6ZJ64_9HYPH|nr:MULTISPECIES: thioesterase family protein [Xanthobacter]MCL8384279.1 acyl-CoA thioesterase [Xanthobacter aminoxidans]